MTSVFEDSTHRRFWFYGSDVLRELRVQALSGTSGEVDDGRGGVKTNPSVDQLQSKAVAEKKKKKKKGKAGKLSGDEEAEYVMQEKVIRHFCRQIEVAMEGYKIKGNPNAISRRWWRVAPTAIIYFRRFYIYNSLRVHDPRIMLLACLLVAGKTEESSLRMKDLKKILPKLVESQVLEAEFKLLKALGAQLHVYHPRNILQIFMGIIKSKHTVAGGKGATVDIDFLELDSPTIEAWTDRAQALLDLLYITEAPLVCKPASLAFAALILSESEAHQQESVVAAAMTGCLPSDKASDAQGEVQALAAAVPSVEAYLLGARACVSGEEAASVGAWIKLSKGAWSKSSSASADASSSADADAPADTVTATLTEEEEEPPRKRVKEET